MNKVIITVVGKDTVGIIAKVCTYLAESQVNILDISQTIVQEFFNMMMIVDMEKSQKPFEEISADLDKLGTQIVNGKRYSQKCIESKTHKDHCEEIERLSRKRMEKLYVKYV